MKLVTYNIQYSLGRDGHLDLARIVEAVRGADIVALQEVARHMPRTGGIDQPARLAELLPEYFPLRTSPHALRMCAGLSFGSLPPQRPDA